MEALRTRKLSALKIKELAKQNAALQKIMRSESRNGRDNMVKLAARIEEIAVTGDEWDNDPMLFGVQNGVIDLRTGELRAGRPDDNITAVSPVVYDPNAECPEWEKFMQDIFASNPELASYLQRVIGYALTGITSEQAFWILYGEGANGKSTFIETIMDLILSEDYSWTMPFPSA